MTSFYSVGLKESAPVYVKPGKALKSLSPASSLDAEGFADYGEPIPVGQGHGHSISSVLSAAFREKVDYNFRPQVPGLDYRGNCEVYRFYMAVLAYLDSERPLLSFDFLMSLVRKEYEGLNWLKKVRTYAMWNAMDAVPLEYPPEDAEYIRDAERYKLVDLGDFFNIRYWLFFDQPDPEDWKSCFDPYTRVKPEHMKTYKEKLMSMLPDGSVDRVEEEEILLSITGSSAVDSTGQGTKPHWFMKGSQNYFSKKPIHGMMSYIQKCPGDTRCSLTLPVPQSNSVKLIEKQVARVCALMEHSAYGCSPSEYWDKYNKLKAFGPFYFCRDVKKDGLTKNRDMVMATLSVLEEKYPGLPAWKYKNIFSSFSFTVNGELKKPPLGVG